MVGAGVPAGAKHNRPPRETIHGNSFRHTPTQLIAIYLNQCHISVVYYNCGYRSRSITIGFDLVPHDQPGRESQ